MEIKGSSEISERRREGARSLEFDQDKKQSGQEIAAQKPVSPGLEVWKEKPFKEQSRHQRLGMQD